jgi:hypothetical protein
LNLFILSGFASFRSSDDMIYGAHTWIIAHSSYVQTGRQAGKARQTRPCVGVTVQKKHLLVSWVFLLICWFRC